MLHCQLLFGSDAESCKADSEAGWSDHQDNDLSSKYCNITINQAARCSIIR